MSMLTPPGMGGKYRITGNAYPRMRRPRRRRKVVLAVVAAVAVLGLGGWGTLQLIDVFSGDAEKAGAKSRAAACKPRSAPSAAPAPPRPAQITVNVYNATPRSGLAKATADELQKRGFNIGKVGNAPAEYDKKVPGAGLLLGAPGAYDGPFGVLGTQLAGAQVKADARTSADVDLIIGTAFRTLNTKPVADKALAALAKPSPAPGECG
ncbi:LytR C-terminal domain-containing protein [Streptomyces sp. NPDC087659]|uniref:LytR C-terminal domain-containing protein n=1 Tax=Streptomyces TaxID=1883 RepID=UPI0025B28667|nr:LytR C-terminal domain-containing protein [Streptomyces sp. HUAS CB01]WJY51349.1 LytR C-terminal domain-containing protein [Streptomyces sp. HUAS CB01]